MKDHSSSAFRSQKAGGRRQKDDPMDKSRGLNKDTLNLVASHLGTNLSIFSTTKVGGATTGWQKTILSLSLLPSAFCLLPSAFLGQSHNSHPGIKKNSLCSSK